MLERQGSTLPAKIGSSELVHRDITWSALLQQLDACRQSHNASVVGILLGTFGVIGLMGLFRAPWMLALLPMPALIGSLVTKQFHCPVCHKVISGDPRRSEVMLFKNLRQCPHCQAKFED
jgi:hypothetical protein